MDKLTLLQQVVKGIEKEGRVYWIASLVRLHEITEAEAGYLTFYFRGIYE